MGTGNVSYRATWPGRVARGLLACVLSLQLGLLPVRQTQAAGGALPLVRDAEIEDLMRVYTGPIFRAAGINETAAAVYLINDQSINAFVAGGQRIFINTGLLLRAKTPNEVIGVLAHETGHIAGGHLARMGMEMDKASTTAIVGMLVGAAAAVGGAMAGSGNAASAGQGLMLGTQSLAQRSLLAYARAQESSADQAAIKFLDASGLSGKGMLDLFQYLATQSLGSLRSVNPYTLTHPMPLERIRNLEQLVKASPNFAKTDSAELVLRHQLMQAKLAGFLQGPQMVYQRYPASDASAPAIYARAIVAFRSGDTAGAMPLIDKLITAQPKYPYFWELKGQALLEGGHPAEAVEPLRSAAKLAPSPGLIQIMLAQALLGTESNTNAQAALDVLAQAARSEADSPALWVYRALAYGKLGQIPQADLATAEAAIRRGDAELAAQKALAASKGLKRGSPEWLRASDILNFTAKKRS